MAVAFTWGTSPAISMQVNFGSTQVTVAAAALTGNSYFGYPIYVDLYRGATCVASSRTFKAASPSQWSDWLDEFYTYSNIDRVRIWASGGATRGAINVYKSGTVTTESSSSSGGSSGSSGSDSGSSGGTSGGGSGSGSGSSAGSAITADSFGLSYGSITIGADNLLTATRPSSAYIFKFAYSFGNLSGELSLSPVSSDSTQMTYRWTPDAALAQQIPNSLSGSGTLTMKVYYGSVLKYTKYYSFVAYVPDTMKPTVSLVASVVNDNAKLAAWGLCAKNMSRLAYTITAAGTGGATIKDYKFLFAGQTINGASGQTALIAAAGTLTPAAQVTDSRGRSTTVMGNAIEVLDYNPPTIRASFSWRSDEDGTENESGSCIWAMCTAEYSAIGSNALTLRARFRPVGGTYGSYTVIANGKATQIGSGLSATTTYEVEIEASDTLGNKRTVAYTSSSSAVSFHLRAGGVGAAFGKYAESNKLECAWDAEFDGNVQVDGDLSVGGNLALEKLSVGGKSLLDLTYPVGAVYISTSNTNPGTLFGGTWEAIDGKFLLGASTAHTAGSTGGAETAKLSAANLPEHTHPTKVTVGYYTYSHSHSVGADKDGAYISGNYGNYTVHSAGVSGADYQIATGTDSDIHTHDVNVEVNNNTGGGQAFSIMPPFLAVYMFKRTA